LGVLLAVRLRDLDGVAAADDADATVRSSARRGLERVESALEPPVAPDR
jgi:hypothetical protein